VNAGFALKTLLAWTTLLAEGGAQEVASVAMRLPPPDAVDVGAADLDRDGRDDLVYLLGGTTPKLRIYFGDVAGFSAARSEATTLELSGARQSMAGKLTIADLNSDGRPDLVVTAGGAEAIVLWNRFWSIRGNLGSWSRTPLPAKNAASAAVAD